MTIRGEAPETAGVRNVVGAGATRSAATAAVSAVLVLAGTFAAGCGSKSGATNATGGRSGDAGAGAGGGLAGTTGAGGSIGGSAGGGGGIAGATGGGPGGGAGGASGGMAGGTAGAGIGGAGAGGGGGIRPGCGSLDIDVPAVGVTATMTFNGVSVPTQQAGWGTVFAHNAAGDAAVISRSYGPPQTQMIIPGTYDLYYGVGASVDTTIPINAAALLRTGVVFPSTGTTPLSVDVPVVALSGAITFGGMIWNDSSDSGEVELFDGLFGTRLTDSAGATYSFGVVPGVYDLRYQGYGLYPPPPGSPRAPFNGGTTLRQGVSIQGPPGIAATLNVDVPATLVSGNITVNGATVSSVAPLQLFDTRTNGLGSADLSEQVSVTQYTISIMPGTYDLYTDGYGSTPRNNHGVVRTGIVIGPSTSTLNIDVPVGTVAGTVTMGGAAVAGTSTDYGDIVLGRGSTFDPDLASIASTDKGSYSAPVLPGTYDVYYQVGSAVTNRFTTISPRNTHAKIASQVTVAATGTTTLNVDVPVATVKGNLTINGAAPGGLGAVYGDLVLVGPDGDQAVLTTTTFKSYSAPVVPGTYDLYYKSDKQLALTGASPVPYNTGAKLRSGVVVASGGTTTLDIDLPTVTVTGAITIAGAAVSNPQEEGVLWLQTDAGDYIYLGATSALSYKVTLVPGQYDLYYKIDSGGGVVPNNTNAKVRCFDVGP